MIAEAEAAEAAEQVETPETPENPNAELEARARRMGWVPKEEFRGDPTRWVEPDAFVARSENELPILKERNRTLDRRLANTERELSGVKEQLQTQNQTLTEYVEFSRRSEERSYTRAKAELEGKRREQIAAADVQGAEATSREIEALAEAKPPAKTNGAGTAQRPLERPVAPKIEPETLQWVEENKSWFNTDEVMNAAAVAIHGRLTRERPDMALADNLAEVKRQIVKRFPDSFENPARRATAAAVTTSSAPGGGRRNGKTYNDLPPDAKAACDKFVRQIPNYKREDYVKQYFAGEEA